MQTTIVVRRPFTILLLLIATVAIAGVTLWMSGKSYSKVDPIPFEGLPRVLALIIVPLIANILLFVPWGFLMFIALYTVNRPTVQTYVLTVLLGLTFTCAIEAWQYFLPSRVADINDIIWNTTGTLAGAILAHLRLRLRFEFQ